MSAAQAFEEGDWTAHWRTELRDEEGTAMVSRKLILTAAALALALAVSGCAHVSGAKFAGGMLTDNAGLTLYTFDRDIAGSGKSACNGACADNWPPFAAGNDDKPGGLWMIVTREDSTKQWAFLGMPLYRWSKDRKPGDKTGDGINNSWHIVTQAFPEPLTIADP
jgi:predicted lipoprotein with Yx(FWY)xxD motif